LNKERSGQGDNPAAPRLFIVDHGGIVAPGMFCAEYYVTEQHFKPGKI
jgi:hypothetical protein|tara:strand:- start:524 stop:667 length:144 start_codon:yes stop_codon:yes gene_type:complete